MSRHPQNKGKKGSLFWIQEIINNHPKTVNRSIGHEKIEWLSPLKNDSYSEYRDQDFLNLLGVNPEKKSLKMFWPTRGPQWDALGISKSGKLILVEAKSHIDEMFTNCGAKSSESIRTINNSLNETAKSFKSQIALDWTKHFYQYTNRLAHAYFLNEINTIPAELVFLYFVDDPDMNGPKTKGEWCAAIKVLHEALGITGNVPQYVKESFIKVGSKPIIAA